MNDVIRCCSSSRCVSVCVLGVYKSGRSFSELFNAGSQPASRFGPFTNPSLRTKHSSSANITICFLKQVTRSVMMQGCKSMTGEGVRGGRRAGVINYGNLLIRALNTALH